MAPVKYITVTGVINNPLDTCVYSLDESEAEQLSKLYDVKKVEALKPQQDQDFYTVKKSPLVVINHLAEMGYRVESTSKDTFGGGMWTLAKKEPKKMKGLNQENREISDNLETLLEDNAELKLQNSSKSSTTHCSVCKNMTKKMSAADEITQLKTQCEKSDERINSLEADLQLLKNKVLESEAGEVRAQLLELNNKLVVAAATLDPALENRLQLATPSQALKILLETIMARCQKSQEVDQNLLEEEREKWTQAASQSLQGQVLELTNQLAELQSTVQSRQQEQVTLEEKVAELEGEVIRLVAGNNQLEEDKRELVEKYENELKAVLERHFAAKEVEFSNIKKANDGFKSKGPAVSYVTVSAYDSGRPYICGLTLADLRSLKGFSAWNSKGDKVHYGEEDHLEVVNKLAENGYRVVSYTCNSDTTYAYTWALEKTESNT